MISASFTLICLILVAIAVFIVQETILKKSFESIGGVLEASRETSNHNFILEVLYNNAVMIQGYCYDPQEINHCTHLQHFS
jgi:predicted ABC-type sugar transport system permease subunit